MNIHEAQAALKQGKKLTHRYFTDDEWILQQGIYIICEDGAQIEAEGFWKYRVSADWFNDWRVY